MKVNQYSTIINRDNLTKDTVVLSGAHKPLVYKIFAFINSCFSSWCVLVLCCTFISGCFTCRILFLGETIKVVCLAKGFPIPNIKWHINFHELENQTALASWIERRDILHKERKVVGRVYAELTMKVTSLDSNVGCQARSSAGKTSATAKLVVHEPPVAPCKYMHPFSTWHSNDDTFDKNAMKSFTVPYHRRIKCVSF